MRGAFALRSPHRGMMRDGISWERTTESNTSGVGQSSPVLELALAQGQSGEFHPRNRTEMRQRGQSVWPHRASWLSKKSMQTEGGTGCSTEHLETDKN